MKPPPDGRRLGSAGHHTTETLSSSDTWSVYWKWSFHLTILGSSSRCGGARVDSRHPGPCWPEFVFLPTRRTGAIAVCAHAGQRVWLRSRHLRVGRMGPDRKRGASRKKNRLIAETTTKTTTDPPQRIRPSVLVETFFRPTNTIFHVFFIVHIKQNKIRCKTKPSSSSFSVVPCSSTNRGGSWIFKGVWLSGSRLKRCSRGAPLGGRAHLYQATYRDVPPVILRVLS